MATDFTLPQNLCPSCFQETNGKYPCVFCGYNGEAVSEDITRLPIGAVLQERYFIGRVLGQGGFGITYSAYDSRLARVSAIKEFFPSGIAARHTSEKSVFSTSNDLNGEYEHGKKKFLEEARVIANFNLPNVVSIRDVFEAHNTVYIVMPLYEGKTLLQMLKEREKISFEETIEILSPIMQALDRIHSNGMVHRDVSPDNIFITKAGEPVLLDFGAVKNALSQANPNSYSVGIVKKGYSAPEQYRNVELGPWTDVYSMSATLYRSVTGKLVPEPMDRFSGEEVPPPKMLGVKMSEKAEAAVMKGLSLNGSERQQSMNDLLEGLGYRGETTPAPSGETPKTENKSKSLALLVATILCVVVAFGYFYKTAPEKQVTPAPAIQTPVAVQQQPKIEAEIPPKVEPEKKTKPTNEEFFELCKYGTAKQMEDAIEAGADVNSKDGDNFTALIFAVMNNPNIEVITTLVKAGAEVNLAALIAAAGYHPNPRVVIVLIEAGAEVNAKENRFGLTALMAAAANNPNREIIHALVLSGANVGAKSNSGGTALMWAALKNSNPDVATTLIKAGADVNTKDNEGLTALQHAANNKTPAKDKIIAILKEQTKVEPEKKATFTDEEFLELCEHGTAKQVEDAIRAGANVNAKIQEDITPLMVAASKNSNPEIIEYLVKAGADANSINVNGWTPLMFAANDNINHEVTAALIKAGGDVNAENQNGFTVLMLAAIHNPAVEVISALLRAGAKVNVEGKYRNVLDFAAESNGPLVVMALLDAGADPKFKDGRNGKTALDYAKGNDKLKNTEAYRRLEETTLGKKAKLTDEEFVELCKYGTAKQVEEAIRAGANVNAQGEEGWTVLMSAACSNSNPEVITVLIEAGANVHAKDDHFGQTVLTWAVGNNPDVLTALINAGADVHAKNRDDCTALMFAAQNNSNPDFVTVLIQAGADVNAKDDEGFTALIFATMHNSNPEVITTLIKSGADVNAKNSHGKTALDYAKGNEKLKNTEAYRRLENATLNKPQTQPPDRLSLAASGGVQAVVYGTDINLRSSPDSTSAKNKIRKLTNGETLSWQEASLAARDNDGLLWVWHKIKTNRGEMGYVRSDLLRIGGRLTGTNVNLRENAALNSRVTENMKGNETFVCDRSVADKQGVTDEKGNLYIWHRISIGGKIKGWISSRYVEFNGTVKLATEEQSKPEPQKQTPPETEKKATLTADEFKKLCESGTVKQVNDAISSGANVNAKANDGSTILMFAAMSNPNPEVITALVRAGADVNANAKIKDGVTVLMVAAVKNSNPRVITALINAGATVNAKNNIGVTALMCAAMSNSNHGVTTALIKGGVNVNAKAQDGGTALLYAAWKNSNPEVITALINGGADINAKTPNGVTALMAATNNKTAAKDRIIAILKNAGAK